MLLKSEEGILTTLRVQVERLGKGDALTHLEDFLALLIVVSWGSFGGEKREREVCEKWAVEDFLIRQRVRIQGAQAGAQ